MEYITTEAERAYRKKYYEKNRARILESRKRRYADNKENELQRSKRVFSPEVSEKES